MSVEKTGPAGYEYQYILTAYAALELVSDKSIKVDNLYVEKISGEDIELRLVVQGQPHTLEIQSKSEISHLDAAKLAEWLCHFEYRSSNACTLSRLIKDSNRSFIIGTASRCTDDCMDLVIGSGSFAIKAIELSKEKRDKLVTAINQVEKGGGKKISPDRHAYCQKLATQLKNKPLFDKTLSKVGIREQLRKETMIDFSYGILNKRYNIPQSQTQPVLLQLLEIIKYGRDSSSDIAVLFKNEILKYQPYAHKIRNYIDRYDQLVLGGMLDKQNFILLKGHSFSGKTFTGHSLMKNYNDIGYKAEHGSDIEEAQAFLNMSIVEDRIYFLDDPMGHLYSNLNSDETLRKIELIATNLPAGRKLIVTCNNEVLRQITTGISLSKWTDLTVTNRTFLIDIWTSLCIENNVPAHVHDAIDALMAELQDEELLQPGQLDYLSKNWSSITDWTKPGLKHFAAIDAARISAILKVTPVNYQRIYRVIGLLADTIHPVSVNDLAMVLFSDQRLPGILENEPGHMGISLFGSLDKDEEIAYPHYETSPEIPDELGESLDFFESKGYLLKLHDGYVFKHPVYLHASLWDLQALPAFQTERLLKDVSRAVAVLNITNALNATRALFTIFHYRPDLRNKLIRLADILRLSIFPAVQDAAFIFLLKNIDHAEIELADKLRSDIANYDTETGSIFWHDGMPVFTDKTVNRFGRYQARHRIPDKSVADEIVKRLSEGRERVTPEEAWNLIKFASQKEQTLKLDVQVIVELLKFNEGFIRAKVAFYYMSSQAVPEQSIAAKLFADVHPNVVFEAYKGAIKGWPVYSTQAKAAMLPMLQDALTKEHIVLRSRDLMTQYAAGYTSYTFDWYEIEEKYHQDMWSLWAQLLPDFFSNFRIDAHFNTSRFVATIRDSEKFLPAGQSYNILVAWLAWLNKYLREHQGANTDLYYLTNHFLEIGNQLGAERESFSRQLIEHETFHFAAYNMRLFLENWDNLTEAEKTLIEGTVAKPENFKLRAIALTARKIPDSVETIICGVPALLQKTPEIIIGTLGNDMVDACLNLDFGSGAYEYLWYGHSDAWETVLIYTLDNPDLPFAKYVAKQVVENHFFSMETFTRRWQTPNACIKKLLNTKNEKLLEQLRCVLLDDLVSTTASTSLELWQVLLENLDERDRQNTVDQVFDCFPAIEMRENLKIPYTIFETKEWNEAFKIRYEDDDVLYETVKRIKEMEDHWVPKGQSRSSMLLLTMQAFISTGKIQMLPTIDYCEDIIEEMQPDLDEIKDGLASKRKAVVANADTIRTGIWKQLQRQFPEID